MSGATREELIAMVLAAPGGIEAMLRQYDPAETIAILRCTPGFLERQLKALYRQKLGKETRFDIVDILMIKELCRRDPDGRLVEDEPAEAAPTAVTTAPSYKQLTPAGAGRR